MSKEGETTIKSKRNSSRKSTFKTKEGREQYMQNLAMDVAEKKLLDGTASSQIICHFLNLATAKAELEREKIRADVELQKAKVVSLESQKTSEELYSQVIDALKRYKGITDEDE